MVWGEGGGGGGVGVGTVVEAGSVYGHKLEPPVSIDNNSA